MRLLPAISVLVLTLPLTLAAQNLTRVPPGGESAESARGLRPMVGAIHVHSTISNGAHDLNDLARLAADRNLDFLATTDSFLTEVRYGVGPFRLFAVSRNRPGVRDHGIEDYLTEARAAEAAAAITVLPAVEVTPHYYWRGRLGGGGLRLFGFDHHLLVFGIDDSRVLGHLPVIGNETWINTEKEWSRALPGVIATGSGLLLLVMPRNKRVRLTYLTTYRKRRTRPLGLGLVLLGGALTYLAYPFGTLSDPYGGVPDPAAHQRVVDYVRDNGGMTFWSYPEAQYPDIAFSGAVMVSTPHPDDLQLVSGYDGFEGLYGDTITAIDPGGIWDDVLIDYIEGQREGWPSVITGIDFHDFQDGGWYELDRGQTVLWTESHNRDALLGALRAGRGYASFQGRSGPFLRLAGFSAAAGEGRAVAGETANDAVEGVLSIAIDWEGDFGGQEPGDIELRIIRDGNVVAVESVSAPARLEWTEPLAPGRHYYRLSLSSGIKRVLSNPIFMVVPGV